MLANVNIRWLANVLLAVAAHSNQALTLHCAFSFSVIKCHLRCLYPLFAISCKIEEEDDVAVEEDEEEAKGKKNVVTSGKCKTTHIRCAAFKCADGSTQFKHSYTLK